MNKIIRTLLIVLLICFIGICGYLGYRFFDLKSSNNELINNIDLLNQELLEINDKTEKLKQDVDSLSSQKSDLLTEHTNWQRQNKKLEEILK